MTSAAAVFVGIDVSCAKQKRLPICFASYNGKRLEPLQVPDELAKGFPLGRGNGQIMDENPFKNEAATLADTLACVAEERTWNLVRVLTLAEHGRREGRKVVRQIREVARAGRKRTGR